MSGESVINPFNPWLVLLAEQTGVFPFKGGYEASPLEAALGNLAEIAGLVTLQTTQHLFGLAGGNCFLGSDV